MLKNPGFVLKGALRPRDTEMSVMSKFIHRFLEIGVRARPAGPLGAGAGGGFRCGCQGKRGACLRAEAWQVQVALGPGLPGLPRSSGPGLGDEGMEQSVPP